MQVLPSFAGILCAAAVGAFADGGVRRVDETRPMLIPGIIDTAGVESSGEAISEPTDLELDLGPVVGGLAAPTQDPLLGAGTMTLLSQDVATTQQVIAESDLDVAWSEASTPVQAPGGSGWGTPNDGGDPDPMVELGGGLGGGTPFGFGQRWLGGMYGGPGIRSTPELIPLPAPVALGLAGLAGVIILRRRLLRA